jgi:two-component system cell cycle sensor histidine kinase/response regulator CckA
MPDPSPAAQPLGTVLVAEDQPAILEMTSRMVQAYGYEVLSAPSSTKLLELAQKHPGRIVALLTDLVMPGMDGQALAAAVKALQPQVKVLYMTGYPEGLMEPDGSLKPGVQLLAKPFTRMALGEKLEELLKGD